MIKISDVLKKAILSEKAYKQMEKGIYTFLVDNRTTKGQIAKAVKSQFSVDAVKVNVSHVFPKAKRIGRTRKQTIVGGGKKAIVQLKSGQSIPMLSPKPEGKKTKKSKKAEGPERSRTSISLSTTLSVNRMGRREKDVQVVSTEGKEGQ